MELIASSSARHYGVTEIESHKIGKFFLAGESSGGRPLDVWYTLVDCIREVVEEEGGVDQLPSLARELKISKLGLDSLGFVILLSKLEGRFGKDPLSATEVPFPVTLGDLVSLYEPGPD